LKQNNYNIAIIGLGYVGLPLAVAFSQKYRVVGFDINIERVDELNSLFDSTNEIELIELQKSIKSSNDINNGLYVTNNEHDLDQSNIYIITVPTPVDKNNKPNLLPMMMATKLVSKFLKTGDIVIYESTVYPGVTEDEMVPILENHSQLKFNVDFFCGYSPERINPGDKNHTVTKIKKITSGSTLSTAQKVDALYSSIITAGTYLAPSIKIAEAAKVIENAQRDINIAFMNELSKIFRNLDIDTNEVLNAASTKWNFLTFKPGLVGGHCIGVDPYYLAQKAQETGYNPEIILSGRRINDSMGKFIATETIKLMINKKINIVNSKILILGFTFKENCPDFRNTKVIDIYNELMTYNLQVEIFDPLVNISDVNKEYRLNLLSTVNNIQFEVYSAIILAVSHDEFADLNVCKNENLVVFDVKGVLPIENIDARL
jgi:UDP-N-acetyl-D-galactosamine dehydrogenase